jgi:uncharacterized membrane protein YphA (DoxX/SURF4 family)
VGEPVKESGGVVGWIDARVVSVFAPQPLARLEVIRILAPLAIVGFMASRIVHADDWLSTASFRVPPMTNDWRQPAAFDGLSVTTAWIVALALAASGIATAVGVKTRVSSAVFCVLLTYVALADRLSAFTVSKISPVIALALFLSPSGTRWSVDAWLRKRREPKWTPPDLVSGGCVRFFQLMLPVFYCSSGVRKAVGDWMPWTAHYNDHVLWTHLHDSYQTPVSWFLANHMPAFSWTALQLITLVFEALAPIWFALRWTRPYATAWALAMHFMIGVMFGPVIWFALLMMALLTGGYLPERWLRRVLR